ncbi:hypothetical protein COCON_G00163780 [Conger conger]|uniref:Uncharacterized protein n=1 Tax=Conger conger TaxID=82655 RepID=A0A9Q1D739_CONCO|nr:hypothetical protein COCON_G00163780 [Conger conger]
MAPKEFLLIPGKDLTLKEKVEKGILHVTRTQSRSYQIWTPVPHRERGVFSGDGQLPRPRPSRKSADSRARPRRGAEFPKSPEADKFSVLSAARRSGQRERRNENKKD